MEQIAYLENLLEGYKERFKRGEKDLLAKIQATAAQLDAVKLAKTYETPKPAKPLTVLSGFPRRCCRGR
jgi:hypothetical protein